MTQMFTTPKNAKPIDIGSFKVTHCPPAKILLEEAKRRQKVAADATRLALRIERNAKVKEEAEFAEERNKARRKARKGKQQRREFFF